MSSSNGDPVLWHIAISHYNEKVRWALDLKGVVAERKAPPPGAHIAVALWLSRGASKTFPVLVLDGTAITDSTEIIAALERRYPEPALYPRDPVDLERALDLEDFFDEELGPHARLLALHELRDDRAGLEAFTTTLLPAPLARNEVARRIATRGTAVYTQLRYRVASDASAAGARDKVLTAFDRLEAELGDGDYLVGDAFSVADLTAAAMFVPVVTPPEGPEVPVASAAYEQFREPLRERRGFVWVEEMFARHRRDAIRP